MFNFIDLFQITLLYILYSYEETCKKNKEHVSSIRFIKQHMFHMNNLYFKFIMSLILTIDLDTRKYLSHVEHVYRSFVFIIG